MLSGHGVIRVRAREPGITPQHRLSALKWQRRLSLKRLRVLLVGRVGEVVIEGEQTDWLTKKG
ncbi:hypothetical protein WDW86_15000, partial [Bdellovibrionota bacterium FG-2]